MFFIGQRRQSETAPGWHCHKEGVQSQQLVVSPSEWLLGLGQNYLTQK